MAFGPSAWQNLSSAGPAWQHGKHSGSAPVAAGPNGEVSESVGETFSFHDTLPTIWQACPWWTTRCGGAGLSSGSRSLAAAALAPKLSARYRRWRYRRTATRTVQSRGRSAAAAAPAIDAAGRPPPPPGCCPSLHSSWSWRCNIPCYALSLSLACAGTCEGDSMAVSTDWTA